MGFWAALQFLTIFPTPVRKKADTLVLGQSLPYFPVVGMILGAILLGLYYGLILVLPSTVVIALLIIVLVILTGAHHIDGFIDTCDGVFASKPKRERLAIMSDTRVGAFGIVGAVILLMLKYASLSSVTMILPALLVMPTLSRWTVVSIIFTFPYARKSGMGLPFKQGATWQRLAIATAIALIVSLIVLRWWGLALMAILWLIVFGIGVFFRSRLGGLTGDNYGAVIELSEVLVLLLIILIGRFQ